ncbi:hypothetical protein Enr13x_66490 [Stieleria neptunia]|uniref:DUF6869 domain-containing protein n=1 Tax=Stieleria neptunia TaxID=2527979 RepID=A0A518I0U2_9BACT|nr:hypothetical protein [Stieleria neptunia]QDV46740.1 hypothetical protein Enr13x_66490 [Stieleria neptunia]
MTFLDPRWDELTDAEWDQFAIAWNAELNGSEESHPLPRLPWLLDDPPSGASDFVVPMNFTASPNAQWKFILAAYSHGNVDTHGHLAAGPVEHLLGNHGNDYISVVEKSAAEDPGFANMLRGCYQYRMTADVWRRLCVARGESGEPDDARESPS